MAGIYIHVPFCKTICIYCDFFTKTNMDKKNPYIDAVCKEAKIRSSYIDNEKVETIYFGGGTPSQLPKEDIKSILDTIYNTYEVATDAEITLEANPDDLNEDYANDLIQIGINRLSMGVQSFDDDELKFLNRRHSAERAIKAVKLSQNAGFKNISIDLMYGLPNQTMDIWKKNLQTAIDLHIQHISSYHLIYEEGTKLYRLLQKGNIKSVDEELSVEMFSTMIDYLTKADFIHYEISSFGKEGLFSKHNSSYWLGTKYLGLGPAAHSFDGQNRSWNISSIPKYISGINANEPNIEIEYLDKKTQYNDFILTGLRTMWGVNKHKLEKKFGKDMLSYCDRNIQKYIDSSDVIETNNIYKLNKSGIFISDSIMSNLMYID